MYGLLLTNMLFTPFVIYLGYLLYFVGNPFLIALDNKSWTTYHGFPLVFHFLMLIYFLFALAQTPCRLFLLNRVHQCRTILRRNGSPQEVANRLIEMENSKLWRINHLISLGSYTTTLFIFFLRTIASFMGEVTSLHIFYNLMSSTTLFLSGDFIPAIRLLRLGITDEQYNSDIIEERLFVNKLVLLELARLVINLTLLKFGITFGWSMYSYWQQRNKESSRPGLSKDKLKKLKKVNFEDLASGNKHKVCTICLEEYQVDDNILQLPCNELHYFHAKCISQWLEKSVNCPLCMANVSWYN